MNRSAREWQANFESFGLRPELVDCYMVYVRQMLRAGLPPIFEFLHLAKLFGRTEAYLASVVNSPESHYRYFEIPKQRGGKRQIAAPYPALLHCQQWINRFILSRVPLHPSAHGFRKRRSIKTNAEKHLGKSHLLKMDLADFFPSIQIPRVISVFRYLGYPPNISFYLSRVCCLRDVLPQGAATSPALSNIIAYRLDCRLAKLAEACHLEYTRYADDLVFSGAVITRRFAEIVTEIVHAEGFQVNDGKTRLCRSHGKRIVTGLSVESDMLRVPREFRRKLRQELHYIFVNGYLAHIQKRKIRDPFYFDSLVGRLLFWRWVEPQDEFANCSLQKLRKMVSRSFEDE